jgi:hypothetical protein
MADLLILGATRIPSPSRLQYPVTIHLLAHPQYRTVTISSPLSPVESRCEYSKQDTLNYIGHQVQLNLAQYDADEDGKGKASLHAAAEEGNTDVVQIVARTGGRSRRQK